MKITQLTTASLLFFLACDPSQAPRPAADDVVRTPLAKADAIGSCTAENGDTHCDGPSAGNCWCDEACADFGDCCSDVAPVCGFGPVDLGDQLTDDDRPAIAKLITEVVYPSFSGAPGSAEALAGALTEDATLKFIKKEAVGRDAFVEAIQDSAEQERVAFAVAVANYRFLVQTCGVDDPGLRPAGLPDSIDLATFDPAAVTPDLLAEHPGLMMPRFELFADLSGKHLAVDRFTRMATFAHSWMPRADALYPFVDRFVVEKRDGEIRVREYEFSMDYDDFPGWPELLTECPKD